MPILHTIDLGHFKHESSTEMNLRDRSPLNPDDRRAIGFTDDASDPPREPIGAVFALIMFLAPLAFAAFIVWLRK